jgi:hypothetical protein
MNEGFAFILPLVALTIGPKAACDLKIVWKEAFISFIYLVDTSSCSDSVILFSTEGCGGGILNSDGIHTHVHSLNKCRKFFAEA